jgi:CheY-like chemotaxis protein
MTAATARPAGDSAADLILIVDDDPAVRALFARVLLDAGYATSEAADGVAALEMLELHQVALILLDSTMPRLDGAGVIRVVRAHPATRTLPIILVTAKGDLEDRVRGLQAGADDYLAKPVALHELEVRVRAQLRIHAAWTQAFEHEAMERRAVTGALRRVPNGGPPERTARALVEELVPALGLEAVALATFSPEGTVIPLAVAGTGQATSIPAAPWSRGSRVRCANRRPTAPGCSTRRQEMGNDPWATGWSSPCPL